jgi:HD superfamily phosphohydrolase
MTDGYARRFRDPAHGYIYVPQALMPLVDSPQVRRLRRVSQNACAQAVYPSLNGSRFEHALGTMHLAMKAWSSAWENAQGQTDSHEIRVRTQLATEVWDYVNGQAQISLADPYIDRLKAETHFTASNWHERFPEIMRECIGAVGLLHDIGHSPFSHTLEPVFSIHREKVFSSATLAALNRVEATHGDRLQFHEICGWVIVRKMLEHSPYVDRVSSRIIWALYSASAYTVGESPAWAVGIKQILSGQVDVDRIDYILRDASRAGTEFGAVDVERLLRSVELHWSPEDNSQQPWAVGISARSVSAVESLLENRERSYRWVYFHPSSLAADTALARAFHMLLLQQEKVLVELDFVGRWSTGDVLSGSYQADDVAALSLLRRAVAENDDEDDVAVLSALMRIADGYEQQFVAAWRNYEELLGAIETLGSTRLHDFLADAEKHLPDPSPADRALHAPEDRVVAALNAIIGLRRSDDVSIERELNTSHRVVDGVKGTWLVALRPSFNSGSASRLTLWRKNREIQFWRVSPSAAGLMDADKKRVQAWGFFVPTAPMDRLLDLAPTVRSIFLHALTGTTEGKDDNA